MLGGYLNAKATLTPMTTDLSTGGLAKGNTETLICQVVDDTRISGATSGRDSAEGIRSVVIVEMDTIIKEGDLLQVTEVRGVAVTRKERIVRSVNVVGGFTASHKEVLI